MNFRLRKDLLVPLLTVAADILAIELAFAVSYWLRFYSPLTAIAPVTRGFPPLEAYFIGSLFTTPAWILLFHARGLYAPRRNTHFSDEFFAVTRVVLIGLVIVMAAAFFYRTFSYSRLVFLLLAATGILFVSMGRWLVLMFERWWYGKGRDLKSVMIVGQNLTARRVFERINATPALGYSVVGYCSIRGEGALSESGARLLGSVRQVPDLVREHRIDLVLVVLPYKDHPIIPELIRSCEGLNTELMMVPDMVELMTSRIRVIELEGIPFLRIKDVALTTWNSIIKRAFDLVVAFIALVLFSPLILLIAILVKITSPGPVFYLQERVGLDGNVFRLIKFRSMHTDAEDRTGPVWAQKSDPRATPLGRYLRRFSIDELPQFINVLMGDMSLVGPRPERPYFVEQFGKEIPKYLDRHRVKAGMTGWAQVNGLRGNAPIEERTRFDVYYVENWSLVFDLKIILKTMHAVLFGKDAQ